MFFRAVAILSVTLQLTVSLLGHFGLHALLGDSHCPAAVHGEPRAEQHSHAGHSDSRRAVEHAHRECSFHSHDGPTSSTLTDATSVQSPDTDTPASDHRHPSHDEHSCEICSVLAQAQTAPAAVAQPAALLLLTDLLTEVDHADAQRVAIDYDSRGPPRCCPPAA